MQRADLLDIGEMQDAMAAAWDGPSVMPVPDSGRLARNQAAQCTLSGGPTRSRLASGTEEAVIDAATIGQSALSDTTMIRRERRNPTLPTKGGPRRVPGCFAKTERELPPPHVLHYNIIVPAESPPLLTALATRISEAETAARGRPPMHVRDAW